MAEPVDEVWVLNVSVMSPLLFECCSVDRSNLTNDVSADETSSLGAETVDDFFKGNSEGGSELLK
jgi:hypothetical protein